MMLEKLRNLIQLDPLSNLVREAGAIKVEALKIRDVKQALPRVDSVADHCRFDYFEPYPAHRDTPLTDWTQRM